MIFLKVATRRRVAFKNFCTAVRIFCTAVRNSDFPSGAVAFGGAMMFGGAVAKPRFQMFSIFLLIFTLDAEPLKARNCFRAGRDFRACWSLRADGDFAPAENSSAVGIYALSKFCIAAGALAEY
jgi:hypothetical protein